MIMIMVVILIVIIPCAYRLGLALSAHLACLAQRSCMHVCMYVCMYACMYVCTHARMYESPSLNFWNVLNHLGIPPLKVKSLLASKPLQSRFSLRELAAFPVSLNSFSLPTQQRANVRWEVAFPREATNEE